ncbi:MAG: DUF1674 domain-containing protein [Pseudomonadota bacterium]
MTKPLPGPDRADDAALDPAQSVSDAPVPEGRSGPAPGSPAERALAEAEARRAALDAWTKAREAETGGRGGKDPVRYGDWEVKGLACDF